MNSSIFKGKLKKLVCLGNLIIIWFFFKVLSNFYYNINGPCSNIYIVDENINWSIQVQTFVSKAKLNIRYNLV